MYRCNVSIKQIIPISLLPKILQIHPVSEILLPSPFEENGGISLVTDYLPV